MQTHLLKALGSLCLASPLLLTTSSCSNEPPPPPKPAIALKSGEVRYHLHIFTTGEALESSVSVPDVAQIKGIYSQSDGEKMLRQFQKKKSYQQTLSETAIARKNQSATISKTYDFRFVTEYDPPVFHKNGNPNGVFPVTPATPSKFETTKLGADASFKINTASGKVVSLSLKLQKKALLGMANYGEPITTKATDFWGRPVDVVITENKIEVPVFRSAKMSTKVALTSGQFILIHCSGSPPPAIPATKQDKPNPIHSFDNSMSGTEKANWVALIQIETAP